MKPIAWTAERSAAPTTGRITRRILPCSLVQRGRLRLGLLDGIAPPSLPELDRRLRDRSWFRLAPTDGDIDPRKLLWELGRFRLLVPRRAAHPEALRAVHGRLPLLLDPATARLANLLGRASWRAHDEHAMECLRRLAFWSLEMGLIQEQGTWRAFGATVATEPELALPERSEPRSFDPDLVTATRPTLHHDGALRFRVGAIDQLTQRLRGYLIAAGLIDPPATAARSA